MSIEGTGPGHGPRPGPRTDGDGFAPPDGSAPERDREERWPRQPDGVTPDADPAAGAGGGFFQAPARAPEGVRDARDAQDAPIVTRTAAVGPGAAEGGEFTRQQEDRQELRQEPRQDLQPAQEVPSHEEVQSPQPAQRLQQPPQYFASPTPPAQQSAQQSAPLQSQPQQPYPQQPQPHQMPMSQQLPPPQTPQYPYQGQHQHPAQHYPQAQAPPQYQAQHPHQQYPQQQHPQQPQYAQAPQYQQQYPQQPPAYPYNAGPNWQWPAAPAPPPKPRVRTRVKVGAAIILVLALAAGGAGVTLAKAGTGGAAATHTTGPIAQEQQISSLWRTASADDLLPLSLSREGTETYQRIGVDPDEQCSTLPAPMLAALHPAGCVRVIQATYVDRTQTVTATVGIVVLSGSQTVRQGLFQDWTPDANASNTAMMPHTYPVPGTVAANFQDAQRVAWESEVTTDGSYLIYTVAGFTDGRTGPSAADRSAGNGSALDSDSPPVEVAGDLPTAISQILVAQETATLGSSGS